MLLSLSLKCPNIYCIRPSIFCNKTLGSASPIAAGYIMAHLVCRRVACVLHGSPTGPIHYTIVRGPTIQSHGSHFVPKGACSKAWLRTQSKVCHLYCRVMFVFVAPIGCKHSFWLIMRLHSIDFSAVLQLLWQRVILPSFFQIEQMSYTFLSYAIMKRGGLQKVTSSPQNNLACEV